MASKSSDLLSTSISLLTAGFLNVMLITFFTSSIEFLLAYHLHLPLESLLSHLLRMIKIPQDAHFYKLCGFCNAFPWKTVLIVFSAETTPGRILITIKRKSLNCNL